MEKLRNQTLQQRVIFAFGVLLTAGLVIVMFLSYPSPSPILDYSGARGADEEVYIEEIDVDECDVEFSDSESVVRCGQVKLNSGNDSDAVGRIIFGSGFEKRESGRYHQISLMLETRGDDAYYLMEGSIDK